MNKELLNILACPRCHGALTLETEGQKDIGLSCPACALLYPIRDDIPIMLVEEAKPFAAKQGAQECASS